MECIVEFVFFFFNDTATTEIYTLSLHDALPIHGASLATRMLFAARWRLGSWFGWDDAAGQLPIPGKNEVSLTDRLPEDLRGTAADLPLGSRFAPLYRTDVEAAAELSNQTVHGVMHLAWVAPPAGGASGTARADAFSSARRRSAARRVSPRTVPMMTPSSWLSRLWRPRITARSAAAICSAGAA